MHSSLFHDVCLRELYGNKWTNQKRIPEIGIEFFECRSSQSFRLHSMLDGSAPPFACDFSPKLPDLLLIAQEDGLVHLYDTSLEGVQAFLKDFEAHANAVFDVKWLSTGNAFLTASGDQSIRLIDTERGSMIQQFFGHTMSVRSLALMPSDSKIFASASRDGSIRIWDLRLPSDTVNFRGISGTSSVGLLSRCHLPNWSNNLDLFSPSRRSRSSSRRSSSDAQSVTSVVFMNDSTLISSGSTDGSIKLWDLRKMFSSSSKKNAKPKHIFPYRGTSQKRSGYSDLQLDSLRIRLYANCLDNIVYEYDLTRPSTSPIFVYSGHQTDSFYIKLDVSPDDNYIVCGSSDRRAHIYTIGQRRQRPVVLSGHSGEVSVPRWCRADPTRIVTLSDDSRAFVWRMFPARRCLLPQPGEVAGLAERLSPSKALMSPSEQTKRIIRSPTLLHNTVTSDSVSPNSFTLSSARRRQLNIRSFLQAISPPNSSTSSPHSLAANIGSLRTRGAATLTETLGGVVQRFPAISVGLQLTSISSNVLPDHSTDVTPRNQTDPAPRNTRLSLSPDSFYSDSSDIENQFTSPARPPLEYADVPTFTNFSVTHSDFEKTPLTPETPPSHRSRPPLIMRQVLFHTPTQLPFCESETLKLSHKRLESNSPTESPSSRFDPKLTSPALICKRRRLTVCPAVHCRSVTGSPTMQKVAPRRRVTTVGQRFKPITSYLKSDK